MWQSTQYRTWIRIQFIVRIFPSSIYDKKEMSHFHPIPSMQLFLTNKIFAGVKWRPTSGVIIFSFPFFKTLKIECEQLAIRVWMDTNLKSGAGFEESGRRLKSLDVGCASLVKLEGDAYSLGRSEEEEKGPSLFSFSIQSIALLWLDEAQVSRFAHRLSQHSAAALFYRLLPPPRPPPPLGFIHPTVWYGRGPQRKRPSLFLVLFLSLHPQQPVWWVRVPTCSPSLRLFQQANKRTLDPLHANNTVSLFFFPLSRYFSHPPFQSCHFDWVVDLESRDFLKVFVQFVSRIDWRRVNSRATYSWILSLHFVSIVSASVFWHLHRENAPSKENQPIQVRLGNFSTILFIHFHSYETSQMIGQTQVRGVERVC